MSRKRSTARFGARLTPLRSHANSSGSGARTPSASIRSEPTPPAVLNAMRGSFHHRKLPLISFASARGERQAVGVEDLVDRLVVGRAAAGAVAGATRGDALRLRAADPRAARVTGLRAHVRARQTADRALLVVHRLALGLDLAAVPARGRAGTADRGSDRGLGVTGDDDVGA